MTLSKVDSESDNGPDKRTKLEDCPEDTKGFAFILLERVAHHDAPLGRPKESGGDAQEGTGENQEPSGTLGLVTLWEREKG